MKSIKDLRDSDSEMKSRDSGLERTDVIDSLDREVEETTVHLCAMKNRGAFMKHTIRVRAQSG
jgi:hypothetical protein